MYTPVIVFADGQVHRAYAEHLAHGHGGVMRCGKPTTDGWNLLLQELDEARAYMRRNGHPGDESPACAECFHEQDGFKG